MVTDGGGWTLVLASGLNFGYSSDFWNGTLGSSSPYSYAGQTFNSGDSETIFNSMPFEDILLNQTGTHIYRSATVSTFVQKKTAATAWSNVSGDIGGPMSWNIDDAGTYTSSKFVLAV
jgi:hypothetical protein